MNEEKNKEGKIKLDPSHYYYNEQGLFVFTEEYHRNRGYCCGSGCKHCCFSPKHTRGVTNINLEKK